MTLDLIMWTSLIGSALYVLFVYRDVIGEAAAGICDGLAAGIRLLFRGRGSR